MHEIRPLKRANLTDSHEPVEPGRPHGGNPAVAPSRCDCTLIRNGTDRRAGAVVRSGNAQTLPQRPQSLRSLRADAQALKTLVLIRAVTLHTHH